MFESLREKLRPEDIERIDAHCSVPGRKIGYLIHEFGLKMVQASLPDSESGYLEYNPASEAPSRFEIVVNQNHPVVRKRWTAAHELGHYLLHLRDEFFAAEYSMRRGDGFYTEDDEVMEREADRFASCILMPIIPFEHRYWGTRSVDVLAAEFWVSKDAVRRRIDDALARRM